MNLKTFTEFAPRQESGEVMFLTARMQKVSSVQWGETDKVTYIELRFHVIFSKDLHKIMVNKASREMQGVKSCIKMHLCKNYVCKDRFKINDVTTILGKLKD